MYPLTLNRLTPSMLATFEKCPLSFYYSYYLGIQVPQQTMHFHFGTGIHEALDHIFGQKDKWSDENVLKKAKDIFQGFFTEQSVNEIGLKDISQKDIKFKDMTKDGLEILDAIWEKKEWMIAQDIDPKEFEIMMKRYPFNPETKEELEVPFSLRIDGLNREKKRIYEFKTAAAKYDETETRNLPQTLAYVWAMYCETGEVYSVDYVVFLKNRKRERIQHLRYEYDIADIIEFDARVRSIIEKIKMRDFNFGVNCVQPWCDCKKIKSLLDINNI